MQRLIEAAKELNRHLWKVQDWSGTYVEKCLDGIDAAISDAEQQADDDALPITWDWLQSIGWAVVNQFVNNPDIKMLHAVGTRLCYEEVCRTGKGRNGPVEISYGLFFGKEILPHIKTRGQLRRLIAALKGGEA